VDQAIENLFKGTTETTTRCLHIDYESKRSETWLDLQMVVTGCKNIYESLDKYTQVRRL
jgi:ubiquitin carboxyl-terminal hydrolase 7